MLSSRNKKEEEHELGPFHNIDKALIVQETKIFNESPLNTGRCVLVLTKLFYLLNQGERLSSREATDAFFAVTKAFQCKDPNLRRLVYLSIKELASMASDVIMVISSLQQDMNNLPVFKACALRALGMVVDSTMISGIERVMKQCIGDKSPAVVSAALTTATHFLQSNREAVKRWIPEIQASLQAGFGKAIPQYHALGLLYMLKQNDRIALSKLSQQMHSQASNPLAICLHLRILGQQLSSVSNNPLDLKPFLRYKGKNDMVVIEAARVICEHVDVYGADLGFAVTAMQTFLTSNKPLLRFAAIRLLNDLATVEPQKVSVCNVDIENLVKDSNRNVATLAITTLLKTGNESSVDRLVVQIGGYISEISDEFKVIVVDAVRGLSLKFPHKYRPLLEFLGTILREEGGFTYKDATVQAICEILSKIPDARELALSFLCEFIEDSEYPKLTANILHLLGEEGPKIDQPSKLVRYIFNRLVLEGPVVRLAAVGALARLATSSESLKPSVVSILRRSLEDEDDRVRDRAVLGLELLEAAPRTLLVTDEAYDLAALEQQLIEYMHQSEAALAVMPFDLQSVPKISKAALFAQRRSSISAATTKDQIAGEAMRLGSPAIKIDEGDRVASIQEFSEFGQAWSHSLPTTLTDPESEYAVEVIKHIFNEHIILEFVCRNTVRELALDHLQVKVNAVAEAVPLHPLFALPIQRLAYDCSDSCFVVFECKNLEQRPLVSFHCTLSFVAIEVDPSSGQELGRGCEDEYPIEGFEIGFGDYVRPRDVPDFEAEWARFGETSHLVETLELPSMRSIGEAVQAVAGVIGTRPYRGTGNVASNSSVHTLLLLGSLYKGYDFAVRARFAMSNKGVATQLSVRSVDPIVSQYVVSAIC